MPNSTSYPQRPNSMRYPGFDYRSHAAYFVTTCTQHGHLVFGQIVDGEMLLNPLGQLAHQAWCAFITHHRNVNVTAFVVMPNHVHVLMTLQGTPQPEPVARAYGAPIAGSLSTLIGGYKAEVTRSAIRSGLLPNKAVLWQGNFWDRIVRDEREFAAVRSYIENNPARWQEDQLHPSAPPNPFNRTW